MTSAGHVVRWCFHTTAMVADYERTRDTMVRLVGLRVLEDSRILDPAIGRRGRMAWLGDNVIEIGEPIVPGGAAERFVSRFGSHCSSIAVQVADIGATVEFLSAFGVRIASRSGDHILFTHPGDTDGVVIEWFGPEEQLDPRFGGHLPPPIDDAVLSVERMVFGGAVVIDPIASAHRLAGLFGHGPASVFPHAPSGSPAAMVSMGDIPLMLYPIPATGESERLWGWRYERSQTANIGVSVGDLDAARDALCRAAVPIHRDEPDQLVIAPSVTGGITLVVVAE